MKGKLGDLNIACWFVWIDGDSSGKLTYKQTCLNIFDWIDQRQGEINFQKITLTWTMKKNYADSGGVVVNTVMSITLVTPISVPCCLRLKRKDDEI